MGSDTTCVFCAIVTGQEPSSKVYQDDRVVAFMGIRPIRPGELIIVPKKHIDHFCDILDDLATHILLQAQRLSRAIRETLNPQRVGLVVHGFGVPHAHLNVVPLHESEDITSAQYAYLDGNRIGFSEGQVPLDETRDVLRVDLLLRHVVAEKEHVW